MRWWIIIMLCTACGEPDVEEQQRDPIPTGPATEVEACAVHAAFQESPAEARQRYPSGMHVIVSGRVDRIHDIEEATCIYAHPCQIMVLLADRERAPWLVQNSRFRLDCALLHNESIRMEPGFHYCRPR